MKAKTPKAPRVRVVITDEMIDQARARDSQHCMIADAIRAAVPDAKSIAVDLATVRFTDPAKRLRYTYLTPRVAQVELVKFDQGIGTDPFQFLLMRGHVTRSGSQQVRRAQSDAKSAGSRKALDKARGVSPVHKQRIVDRGNAAGTVPDRVGGRTPPLQKGQDGVPFSRRRAFGLRGLAL